MKKLFSVLVGIFIYYLIGYFISDQSNPMLWPVYGKVIFVVISFLGIKEYLD